MRDHISSGVRRLSGREPLKQLSAVYAAAILLLAATIWFEFPTWLTPPLLAVALVFAVLTAISIGITLAEEHAQLPYTKRPTFSGRTAGALTFVALTLIAIACAYFVYPRSWPTSVEEAIAILSSQLDADARREIAYLSYDQSARLQDTLGVSVREQFGLNRKNFRLAYDCDAEYMNPHTCASIIISRLWKKAREELPPAEREALERMEKQMERVRLKSQHFDDAPLEELARYFNAEIRRQLADDAQLAVTYDRELAREPVSTAWHAIDTISLAEALGVLEQGGSWRVRKEPPQLVLERS